MKSTAKLTQQITKTQQWPNFTFVTLFIVTLCLSGVSYLSAFVLTGILLMQVYSGSIFYQFIIAGPGKSAAEVISIGFAIGATLAVLSEQILRSTPLKPVAWTLPVIISLYIKRTYVARDLAGNALHYRALRAKREDLLVLVILCLGVIPFYLVEWRLHPLTDLNAWYPSDYFFHEAVANSIYNFGPFRDPQVLGGRLFYHWFWHAWSGVVTHAARADQLVVMSRTLQIAGLFGTALAISAFMKSISAPKMAAVLCAIFFGFGRKVFSKELWFFAFDQPVMSTATYLTICYLLVVFQFLLKPSKRGVGIVCLLVVLLTMSRAPYGLVALSCFLVCVLYESFLVRRIRSLISIGGALSLCAFLTVSFLFMSGSGNLLWLEFGKWQLPAKTLIPFCIFGLGLVCLWRPKDKTERFAVLFGAIAVSSGALVVVFLRTTYSFNLMYFIQGALTIVIPLAVLGLSSATVRLRKFVTTSPIRTFCFMISIASLLISLITIVRYPTYTFGRFPLWAVNALKPLAQPNGRSILLIALVILLLCLAFPRMGLSVRGVITSGAIPWIAVYLAFGIAIQGAYTSGTQVIGLSRPPFQYAWSADLPNAWTNEDVEALRWLRSHLGCYGDFGQWF